MSMLRIAIPTVMALLLAGAGVRGLTTAHAAERRPNVLIIYVDDMGYGDLSCQGSKDFATPHIDSIAKNGVRFTDGYVTAPVCSPSRAALITGRYQQRFGHEFNTSFTDGEEEPGAHLKGLDPNERTFAEDFRDGGYKTGLVGKWHLGLGEDAHPVRRGFDEFFGFRKGRHAYIRRMGQDSQLERGTEKVDEPQYLTDALSREAASFIDRHRNEPFCLLLTYNAPHVPMEAPPRYLDRVKHLAGEKKLYGAMVTALDDGVGVVLKKLAELGLEKDTLVFFVSDNGGREDGGKEKDPVSSMGPFSGGKQLLFEGGIRVPFLMQWKGTLPAGVTYAHPVISLDIIATAEAVAGVQRSAGKPLDGVNLMPFLTAKEQGVPHEFLFWRLMPAAAVRSGKWKLMRPAQPGQPTRLYDLEADPAEKTDVAAANPDAVKRLAEALARWESQLVAPKWEPAAPKDGVIHDSATGKRIGRVRGQK